MEDVRTKPDQALFERGQQVDDGFHNLLIAGTQNDLLIQAYGVNSIRIRLIKLDRVTLSAAVLPAAFADHLAIIAAIRSRNPHEAMDAMDRHMMNARERALEL
jgi:DNA-binding GntR family transcriptional regulator